jgi:hypothetical protein
MTIPAETVSIYTLTAKLLDETSLHDPREIAEKLAGMIPESEKHRILVDALVGQVRTVMGSRRNTAMSNAFKRPVDAPAVGGSIQSSPKPVYRPRPSKKVAGIRDWWAEMLRERVHVGTGTWTTLGACGVAELEFAERYRRDQADKEVAAAKKFLALRMLLDEHQVATVADLPPHAARAVWS